MSQDKSKPTSPENLVQSSSAAPVELAESDLEKVAGGTTRKAAGASEYLKSTMVSFGSTTTPTTK